MQTRVTPIAVIGMGCRLPGGIDSPDKLWESVLRGDDLVTEIPPDRWDADAYYDPEPGVPGRTVSRWGGFVDDVAGFDADFFGINEREAIAIDPQHRFLLEAAWEAIEQAGLDPASLAGSSTAVFTGLTHEDYLLLTKGAGSVTSPYTVTGVNNSVASGRISHALGLHGPAMTFDTACSSGLMAVHLACRSLHEGESDLALAGGCALLLEPEGSVATSGQGMLSPTGRCHSFDAAADGFVRSEGCAVVLLKRLPDALADGDRILAVIRGTAANQDGRSETIMMPSEDAQVAVYRAALAAAGVQADSVGAVETHGTGTPVGDPIEYRSLTRVYGSDGHRCALGSVKSNMGHSESAAGAVGLIKAILSLRHGVVPKILHFTELPEELVGFDSGIIVPQEITPWPDNTSQQPRRMGVSSFGMSGTNVHAILEEAPAPAPGPAPQSAAGPLVFALSSSSADGLRQTARRLAEWVDEHQDSVTPADLGYTLARRRAHRPVRTMVVADGLAELAEGLREVADGDAPYEAALVTHAGRGPVWVFSGQGSQWAAMGADLLAGEPVFAATIAELEPLIAAESGFSVTEAMTAPQTVTGIDKVQPTIFAIQVALAATMEQTYGVRPGAVVGHSMGETAAAVVAGALSAEDGARVICRRSKLMAGIAGSGAMASVELPAKQVISELMARGISDVAVAVMASPQSTVIGGAGEQVRELVARWEQRDVMAREVAVDVASHSPQVDPILDDLEAALADLEPMAPKIPYYSATLFDPRERPVCDAGYWVDNLRNTVQFAAAIQAALDDGFRIFAELSPHPLLTHAVDQNARSLDMTVRSLAAIRRDQPLPHGLRGFLTDLHGVGAAIDFSVLYPAGQLVDAPLPAWSHRHLFIDAEATDGKVQGACTVTVHPLLGSHVRLVEEPERHVWQTDVGTATLPWLDDHRVHNVAALPGAAYCEMALAAATEIFGEAPATCWEARDIAFEQMLLLDDKTPIDAVASVQAPGVVEFVVESVVDGESTRHATAWLRTVEDESAPPAYDVAALLAAHPHSVKGSELRQSLVERGVQHGPAFSGLAAAHTAESGGNTVLAEVALPASIRFQHAAYHVHPALLDACFQSVAAGRRRTANGGGLLLPLGVSRLRVYGPLRNAHYCYGRVTRADATGGEADLDVLDEHGNVLLAVRGLRMGTGTTESGERDRILNERLLSCEWQQRTLPDVDADEVGSWLLIDTSDALESPQLLVTTLTDALKSQGAECFNLPLPLDSALESAANLEGLRAQLHGRSFHGVVILCGPIGNAPADGGLLQGREQVRHLVRIVRELPELKGELPRLFVVTRQAQWVRAGDELNLEQAGLRGLLRVIGSEHQLLRTTQIDVDEHTLGEQVAQQLLSGSPEDETAWRNGDWYTARLCPAPLAHEDRKTAVIDHETDGMRLQVRAPGDLQSLELAACDRVPPGPGQIEVAVAMSTINFADVLIAFGKFPVVDDREPQPGMDFVGVVTAVGEGVARPPGR